MANELNVVILAKAGMTTTFANTIVVMAGRRPGHLPPLVTRTKVGVQLLGLQGIGTNDFLRLAC